MSSLVRHPFSDFSRMAAIAGGILAAVFVIFVILIKKYGVKNRIDKL
jgi:hypothetical protein